MLGLVRRHPLIIEIDMSAMMSFDPDFAEPSEWAKMYREHGLQVVPAMSHRDNKSQWKRPALPTWRALEHELVPDLTFERWYGENGEHARRVNMGLICGACSDRVFVIDLDLHKHEAAQAWWLEMHDLQTTAGELETVEQVTGGGGIQLFFRAPAGWVPPTCKTSIGVDIRGQGGFAMLPPSLHESGNRYRFKAGHELWSMDIADAPQWLCDQVTKLAVEHGGSSGVNPVTGNRELTSSPSHAIDSFGNIVDGREDYMTKLVWAAIVDLRRDAPIPLTVSASTDEMMAAFANYARNAKSRISAPGVSNEDLLEREGRGISMFRNKWTNAMAQWDGKVSVAAQVPKAVRPFEAAPEPEIHAYDFDPETGELKPKTETAPAGILEFLDVDGILGLADPDYLIENVIIEEALGFVFGAPGCGKSFLTMGMALSIASQQRQWFNRDIKKTGPVIYISSEGVGDMKFRIKAWGKEMGVEVSGLPFYLIRQSINFMNAADVELLIKTVAHIAQVAGAPPVLVVVDTVSRVLPGADENLQKDMTLFIAACDAVRTIFHATVIGVHHTSRAGNLRGSTVFDGAGDFLLGIEREEGEKIGNIHAKKIKSAEDGWDQPFELVNVVVNDITGKTSLYARVSNEAKKEVNIWPPKEECRKILAGVSRAWNDGKPWSTYPQTRKQGRFAPAIISQQFDVPEKVAEMMIDAWLSNAVLAYEMVDKSTKMQGLKVIGSID